jgi:threonine aldolase
MAHLMNLFSDNTSGIAPEILSAIQAANTGAADSYGDDQWTARAEERFRDVFETDLDIYPLSTGTAANAVALSTLAPPYGAILCHPDSHINVHQCAASEFYTGGAKLLPTPGAHGKIAPKALEDALVRMAPDDVHQAQVKVLSLTQTTDFGTVYTPAELAELSALAHGRGLRVHMDGARFANAVTSLGVSPADLSWRSGVDILCFGASKNGALAAEAVVVFDRSLGKDLGFRRKRGGHLLSKMRYLSAQLEASLCDDLWLRLAGAANAEAAYLADKLRSFAAIEPLHPCSSNMLWLRLPKRWAEGLAERGYPMGTWESADEPEKVTTRWVTAWDTQREDIDLLLRALEELAAEDTYGDDRRPGHP